MLKLVHFDKHKHLDRLLDIEDRLFGDWGYPQFRNHFMNTSCRIWLAVDEFERIHAYTAFQVRDRSLLVLNQVGNRDGQLFLQAVLECDGLIGGRRVVNAAELLEV
jgi:hypothetical protein